MTEQMAQRYYVEQAHHVHRLCRILAKNDAAALVSQMETWQQRRKTGRQLKDIVMREEVCVELLGECEAEEKAYGEDDPEGAPRE